jgi:putative transcriptional regulator
MTNAAKKMISKKTKTRLMDTAHDMAKGLYQIGVIDATTMREFDVLCLPKVKDLSDKEIKTIRLREKVSQAVFASYLNTTSSTVQQWERGEKHPRGTSLKLLNLVADKGLTVLI